MRFDAPEKISRGNNNIHSRHWMSSHLLMLCFLLLYYKHNLNVPFFPFDCFLRTVDLLASPQREAKHTQKKGNCWIVNNLIKRPRDNNVMNQYVWETNNGTWYWKMCNLLAVCGDRFTRFFISISFSCLFASFCVCHSLNLLFLFFFFWPHLARHEILLDLSSR